MNKEKKKTVEYGRYGIIFLIPFFVAFFVFQFYPLIYTIFKSFLYDQKVGRNASVTTVAGLGNYTNYVFGAAGQGEFWQALLITVVLWLLNFIPQILIALLFAAWFTDSRNKLKGTGAFKVMMYMPNIITAATIAVLFYNLFNVNGVFTKVLINMGLVSSDGFMEKGWGSLLLIAFIQFWMWYGNTMIVLIAGILGISPSLYEAAMVDGATSRQQFFKITVPLLRPILQYTMVTSAIGGLQMYDIPQLLNKGGPVLTTGGKTINSTTTVVMLIKKYASTGSATENLGRASAYSVVLFLVTLCVSMIFYRATAKKN
ncbi:MAG: sugar ABC transporter permease [Clostridium sp.]|nr:sugar ABC transporter permease [Clostridium sp.]